MDFEEFLLAMYDNVTMKILAQFYEALKPLGDPLHRQIMRQFRLYMLVGGMPQSVDTFLRTNRFKRVDQIKRDIIALYRDDFYKIDDTGRLAQIFEAIPAQLNSAASAYQTKKPFNPIERVTRPF